jgi:transposase
MEKDSRFVGLDVHAETIAVAVAEPGGEVRTLGTIPNTPDAVRRLITKLGAREQLRVCYEAGPTGYVLYRQLTQLGVRCVVVAPTLVPVKAGDRVKTDRRDAEKLARSYRSDDLTAVWVPDAAHEALRDLVRAREAAKRDQLRARHRLSKFLLRPGRRAPAGITAWGIKHGAWVKTVRFEQPAQEATLVDYVSEVNHATERIVRLEQALGAVVATAPPALRAVIAALQALRGVAVLGAVTLVTEVGSLPGSRTRANSWATAEPCRASTRAGPRPAVAPLPRRAMRTCAASSWRQRTPIDTARWWGARSTPASAG